MSDITEHNWSDGPSVNSEETGGGNLRMRFGPAHNDYLVFNKSDAIAIAKHFGLLDNWISVDDVKFLLSFAPKEKHEQVTKGLQELFYHTFSYKGDVKLAARIEKIRRLSPPETI